MKFKITFFAILGIIILNVFALKNFYFNDYGNKLFEQKKYDEAMNNFVKSNNIEGFYNKGNVFYKQKKYDEAIKKYLSILTEEKNDINFSLNHNLGNSYYRFGELEKENPKKIKYWQEAVKYYKQALDIKYDLQTKQNLDFVLNKIKDEEKKQEEQKKNNQEQNQESKKKDSKTGSGKNSENKEQNKKGEQKDGKSEKETKGGENKKAGKESKDGKNGNQEGQLTKEQEQALKKYEEALKQAQKDNSDSFNKVYQDKNNDPFEQFFNDTFFDNSLLDNNSGKKDW